MKARTLYLPLILAAVLVAGIMLGRVLPTLKEYDKLDEVISYIRNNYVEDVSKDRIEEQAVQAMLFELDPHSEYLPADMVAHANDQLSGSFYGIGVQFRILRDSILIIRTIEGGPSEKAGLRAGDRIVTANDDTIAGVGISNKGVLDRLKGPLGTQVEVRVFRRGNKELIPYTITRGKIPSESIDISFMPDERTGYIKVSRFTNFTYHEFIIQLSELIEQGAQRMIIDLRGNRGGFLSTAVAIADEFLPTGTPIVYTEGKFRDRSTYNAQNKGLYESGELIILIDENSASASEILAGAIQDNDRGTIIGRRSFGKALVQEQMTLSDSSAIRLTVARYYTPTGRSIQRPYENGHSEYYNDIIHRYVNGEMLHPDSIHFIDSLKYTTPGGKTVYGGGGIMPDIFVPVDSVSRAPYYNELIRTDFFYDFVADYIDANRDELELFMTANGFIDGFVVSEELYGSLLSYSASMGLAPADVNSESEQLIRNRLKAFIGRDVYGDAAFYPIYLRDDKVFLKALQP